MFLFDIQMKQSYQKNMQSHGWGNIRLLMGIVSYSDLIGLSIGFFFFYYRTIPILIVLFLSHWGGPTLEILVCCCLSSWNCKRFSSTGLTPFLNLKCRNSWRGRIWRIFCQQSSRCWINRSRRAWVNGIYCCIFQNRFISGHMH